MIEKLFVYGILTQVKVRREVISEDNLRYLGEGSIEAELYDLGAHPAAIPCNGKRVNGTVYELADLGVLEQLDEFEEYKHSDPKGSLYVRAVAEVTLENGKTVAYVYFYNRSVKKAKKIVNGKWK